MKASAAFANAAWLASSVPAWRRFVSACERPEGTQREILRRLLEANSSSAYGRAHQFDRIRHYEQFREGVPLVDYDALEPWITRIMRGDGAVLTCEPVTRLVPTSGSTGGAKLIPFTATLQREFNAAISPWVLDICQGNPRIVLGPAYWSISPALDACKERASAVPIGFEDDSAYLGGVRRRLVETTFAVPSALRLVRDMESFRYLTLLCLLRQPELRLVSVWHPSFLTLLLEALPAWWDELLEDIAGGGSRRHQAIPPEVRSAMVLDAMPMRAAALRRRGPTDMHLLWPKLRFVSCWGDAQAALPLNELQRRLPQVTVQPKGLLATEACVSLPFRGRHPIAVTSHFFEFADERGRIHLAHELQRGERYTVIVSTGGGLWRYRLGDVVEVDGFHAATPSLRFVGRSGGVVDLCGEKLLESFVTQAIATACRVCDFITGFAMLAPEEDTSARWRYTLFVEGAPPASFCATLEDELRRNPHYALCRRLGQLGALRLCVLDSGAYGSFCQACISEGRRYGDIKPQSLSSRPDWRSCLQVAT